MFRHLRAILRERLCPREYAKTKAAMYGLCTHYLVFCTSSPVVFLLLLPASIPRFYYFIRPLYILDMTDSVLLCYLPTVSFWLWLIVVYTPFCIF
jgi:hypothetical protein